MVPMTSLVAGARVAAALGVATSLGVLAACSAPQPQAARTFVDNGTAVSVGLDGSTSPSRALATTTTTTVATTTTAPPPTTGSNTPLPTTPTSTAFGGLEPPPTTTPPVSAPPTTSHSTTTPSTVRESTTATDGDKSRAADVAQQLYNAWTSTDRAAANRVATPSIVSQLFAHSPVFDLTLEDACSGGVGNYLCNLSDSQGATVQMWVAHERGTPMVVRGLYLIL